MSLLKEIHGLINSKVFESADVGSLEHLKQSLAKIDTPSVDDFVKAKVNKDESANAKIKKFENEMLNLWDQVVQPDKNRKTPAARLWSSIETLTSDRMGMPGYWGSSVGERDHGIVFTLKNALKIPSSELEKVLAVDDYKLRREVESLIRKHNGDKYESPHDAINDAFTAARKATVAN